MGQFDLAVRVAYLVLMKRDCRVPSGNLVGPALACKRRSNSGISNGRRDAMSELSRIRRWMGALAGAAALGLLFGADEPAKTVEAGGLSFKAPESWKSVPTNSSMRKAQLKVDPVNGDGYAAELVVYAFAGGAGTVEANLARWQGQFKDADGNPPKIASKTIKVQEYRGHARRDGGPLQSRGHAWHGAGARARKRRACWLLSSRPPGSPII